MKGLFWRGACESSSGREEYELTYIARILCDSFDDQDRT